MVKVPSGDGPIGVGYGDGREENPGGNQIRFH